VKRAPWSHNDIGDSRCTLLSFPGLFELDIQELGTFEACAASLCLPACGMILMQINMLHSKQIWSNNKQAF
jgi:hypothetical protein